MPMILTKLAERGLHRLKTLSASCKEATAAVPETAAINQNMAHPRSVHTAAAASTAGMACIALLRSDAVAKLVSRRQPRRRKAQYQWVAGALGEELCAKLH